ncbi:hypothetical protein PR048_021154 [Dryococelus australis]|uniref:Uncharacterized protein n=1 Tax=Dryococelus australis TaxID=614101 RepID=A0ABQ9GXF6_9NEOP|nr:hypothetical protein PR048_021154 [Dryococelus australis]
MKFNLDISDKRGTHHNRPRAVSFDVKELVRDHISSMPAQESHYLRSTSIKLYLSSELCVERMDIFRSEFKLIFGPPRPDSCSYCDELYIHLVAAETEDEQKGISAQSTLHHRMAETAYKVLHEDVAMSKSNPTYATGSSLLITNVSTAWDLKKHLCLSEVTSCIPKYIELHCEPLKVGEMRR